MSQAGISDTPSPGPESGRHYSAFLSYAAPDRKATARLHGKLESYRLPRKLAAQVGADRIRPVFMDRAELTAAPDVEDALRAALIQADYLIVACSPNTPNSQWVGREIELFREVNGSDRILVALLEGDKVTSFHPALLVRGPDHEIEPLAADFTEAGDGERQGLLKLLAALIGVPFDALAERDGKRRVQRLMLASVLGILALTIMGGLTFWARSSEIAADKERIEASLAMERQLDDLRDEIKAGGNLDMAAAINRNIAMFYEAQEGERELPEVEMGRARLAHAMAEDELSRGDLEKAAEKAREALGITSGVVSEIPEDPKAIYLHAQSAYWVGATAWQNEDTPLAANAFARYADLARQLVAIEPDNPEFLLEQGYANSNLGVVAMLEARDFDRARTYFEAAQSAFRRAASLNPDDPGVIYELADGEAWLADANALAGRVEVARRHRAAQSQLLKELMDQDPGNNLYLLDHVSAQLGSALLEERAGKFSRASDILASALEDATALMQSDPSNPSLADRKRGVELYLARNELKLGETQPLLLTRAKRHLGDCSADWSARATDELPVFCTILAARLAHAEGKPTEARRMLRDPRIADQLGRDSLSEQWQIDFAAECRLIGEPELCR